MSPRNRSGRSFLVPLLLGACLGLGLGGCGGEGDSPDERPVGAVPSHRDPTLRGLAQRLTEAGLSVSKKLAMDTRSDQTAKLGRAAGIANELAGAGIRSDLAVETELREIAGFRVVLERFDSREKTARVLAQREEQEARARNPGAIVYISRGDKLLTLKGPLPPATSMSMPGLPAPRPQAPPDPGWVDSIRQALEAVEAP